MPWTENSMRDLPGRLRSMVKGASMPGPMPIVPVMRVEFRALILSRPPMA